jgi:16S rRNA (cytosine1402-N4)-methyltransferase
MEALEVKAAGFYMDGTYGRGGHAGAIASRLGPDGRLWVTDRDPDAVAHARERFRDDPRCAVVQAGFDELPARVQAAGCSGRVDGVLLDLGVSSPQLDDAGRGFSIRHDGPLDMRMDPAQGESAYDWLCRASAGEIRRVLHTYGEERHARRVTSAIIAARDAGELPRRTGDFAALVQDAMPADQGPRHPATRVFQAIRIHINGELAALERFLAGACEMLAPGGRLVVISFHSLEDRRVKRFMRDHSRVGDLPPGVPEPPPEKRPDLRVASKPVRADEAEKVSNPRSRSAVMRVAERLP